MLLSAVFLHNIDPFAIHFPEGWPIPGIRWYGLSYLLGFMIAYVVIKRVVRAGRSTLQPQEVGDLVFTLALGVVIGGRLGYCLFYRPSLFTLFLTDRPPWWGVLMINEGGMSSHGGMIGGVLASWWYAHRHKHPWPHVLDLFAFGAPLGLFFGRIANFVNGELYGRPFWSVPPNPEQPLGVPGAWAVRFPQEMFQWDPASPADAVRIRLMQNALRLVGLSRPGAGLDEQTATAIAAIQSGSREMAGILGSQFTPRHPSQLYEAVLEGLVLFVVLALVWRRPRKPLVVGGVFCVAYGVVRIICEFFRTPDAHIADEEFAHWGVTRGQWLSALLVLIGVALLVIFRRRKAQPMGAWRLET